MRLLAFDHFYDQDLAALSDALTGEDTLDVIGYRRLHRLAKRHFPESAFTGLAAAYRLELSSCWSRYDAVAHRFAAWIASAYRPNVFVAPTDAIFYLRPVIAHLKAVGVPTAVVQKETTISPLVMGQHAREVAEHVPFMSDLMTVCSERHRSFWIRTGADADRVHVTGQPRFDPYAAASPVRAEGRRPRLLYLSYDDVAYLPGDLGGDDHRSWRDLRRETEVALTRASADWEVVAKLHPQQQPDDDWLGSEVRRAERGADTRDLIMNADVVVAFQTTGIFEAALASRPVLYPAWGDVYEKAKPMLIAFEDVPGLVTHASSASMLTDLLAGGQSAIPVASAPAMAVVAEHLGPADGQAAQRVVGLLRQLPGDADPPAPSHRQVLAARASAHLAPLIDVSARIVGQVSRPLGEALSRRAVTAAQLGTEARIVAEGSRPVRRRGAGG